MENEKYERIGATVTRNKNQYDAPPSVTVEHHAVLGQEADVAVRLVESWGMVVAANDGEDTAGRTRKRTATPAEVVDRAVETTRLLFARIRAEGWLIDLPQPLAIVADADEDAREAQRR